MIHIMQSSVWVYNLWEMFHWLEKNVNEPFGITYSSKVSWGYKSPDTGKLVIL